MKDETNRKSGIGRAILLAGIAAGIALAYFLSGEPGMLRPLKAGRTGTGAEAARPPAKPGMDLVKHPETETATFGMG